MKGNLLLSEPTKQQLRRELSIRRQRVSRARREQASKLLAEELLSQLICGGYVLSFVRAGSEIDLFALNLELARSERLCLPMLTEETDLVPYRVGLESAESMQTLRQWEKSAVIKRSLRVELGRLSYVLVPGLGFDSSHHRLGYGGGHYDRLLDRMNCPKWGVGFREQLLADPIPIEEHDHPLDRLYLF